MMSGVCNVRPCAQRKAKQLIRYKNKSNSLMEHGCDAKCLSLVDG